MPPPSRRSPDDNPFVSVFVLVVLLGIATGAIWYATQEKVPAGNQQYSGPPTDPKSHGQPGPGGPLQFVDAFKRLPDDATVLQRAADEEFDNVAKVLSSGDLATIEQIIAKKAASNGLFNDDEIAILRRHGLTRTIHARAARWAQDDPGFKTASGAVWGRSPQVRESGELTELAARWGEMSRMARLEMLQIIHAVESKSRDLSDKERAALTGFAGEDYLARRP